MLYEITNRSEIVRHFGGVRVDPGQTVSVDLRPMAPLLVRKWRVAGVVVSGVADALSVAVVAESEAIFEPLPDVSDEERTSHPLDHDNDGRPGGSLPASERDVCDDLRAEYEAVTGRRADMRWGEARLRQEIANGQPQD